MLAGPRFLLFGCFLGLGAHSFPPQETGKCEDHPDCHPIDPHQCALQAKCCPRLCACCGQPTKGPYCDSAPACGSSNNATAAANATEGELNCHAISPLASDLWCNANCNHDPPFCPANICKCSPGPAPPPPPEPLCLHHEDSNKCYQALIMCGCSGFSTEGGCEPKYNVVDSTVRTYQCPDGTTNIKYCQLTILEVTVTTKGIGGV